MKKLRGNIDTKILLSNIPQLIERHERTPVEIVKLVTQRVNSMKTSRSSDLSYEIIRSRRATADIVVERDGRVVVRAPEAITHQRIEDLVEAKQYWIYKTLAEWRDVNARRSCASIAMERGSSILVVRTCDPHQRAR